MDEQEREDLTLLLRQLMADTLAFKLKAQFFHHHVKGINFNSLHSYFQDLYEDMEVAYDEIGEQIRLLGETAPGSLEEHGEFKNIGSINREKDYSPEEMVDTLFHDNDSIRDHLKDCEQKASEIGAENVLDFFVERHRQHDQHHYFLGSLSMNL